MSDRYLGFANSNLGRRLVDALGLPRPAALERWQAGRLRPVRPADRRRPVGQPGGAGIRGAHRRAL